MQISNRYLCIRNVCLILQYVFVWCFSLALFCCPTLNGRNTETQSSHSNLAYFSEVTSISYTVEICLLRGFFRSVMIPIFALHFSLLLDWYKRFSWICECEHDAVIQSAQFASQFVIWKQKEGPCGYLMKKHVLLFSLKYT